MKRIAIALFWISILTYGCSVYRFNKEVIYTENAPKPIGPYSQAVKIGKFIFVSGQIGIEPKSGKIAEDVETQFKQAMENIQNILSSANSNLSKVVKVTIFLKDLKDFEKINRLYETYFTGEYPARETVEVSRLPKDAKVEISVIAFSKK